MGEMQRLKIFREIGKFGLGSVSAIAPVLALALMSGSAARAAGPITFAQYFEQAGNQQWSISQSGGTTSISASGQEFFLFSNTLTAYNGVLQTAQFTLNASSTQAGACGVACAAGDSFAQLGYSGTFSFVATSGPLTGLVLLGGTFNVAPSGATLNTNIGSSQAGIGDSSGVSDPSNLTFNSQVPGLSFASQTELDASWSLSSLNPNFAVTNITFTGTGFVATPSGSYTAAGSGTFATEPGFIPEPGSLYMTSIGIGLCGLALLSRRVRARLLPGASHSS